MRRYLKYKLYIETLDQLLYYQKNKTQLNQLKLQIDKCQPYLSHQAIETINDEMSLVNKNITDTWIHVNFYNGWKKRFGP